MLAIALPNLTDILYGLGAAMLILSVVGAIILSTDNQEDSDQ